jgi:tRNA threonylcarbamoyladenosine biosynthesis protein TsaB
MMSNMAGDSSSLLILSVDTSSPHVSFAITSEERVMASLGGESEVPHSRTFFANLSTLLQLADLKIEDIDVFAAATGPGSFTGLRVGLAAIKGLARTLAKPSIGINSIDALALTAGVTGIVLVMIKAGRDEVYCGLRQVSSDGMVSVICRDRVGAPSSLFMDFAGHLAGNPIVIVGDGAVKYQKDLENFALKTGANLNIASRFDPTVKSWLLMTSNHEPAVMIGRYAAKLMQSGATPEIHAFYIRPSDAEIKWNG